MIINKSLLSSYRKQLRNCSIERVLFFNFWEQPANEIWFYGFLKSRGLLEKTRQRYYFFSCLGNKKLYNLDKVLWPFNTKRIFFSGENLHRKEYSAFEDYYLNENIDLALGFDYIDDSRYLRFPIWICEIIPPDADSLTIKNICKSFSNQKYDKRDRFCAMVASGSLEQMPNNESLLLRKSMVDSLNKIKKVDCAGRFLNNTDEMKIKFNDNKIEYLKQYKFFICPENSDYRGYITEKLFHCIQSGCIPVYEGGCGNPEPDVINKDAVLFWNGNTTETIRNLMDNEHAYKDFFEQPRFKPYAADYICEVLNKLESAISNQLCKKN